MFPWDYIWTKAKKRMLLLAGECLMSGKSKRKVVEIPCTDGFLIITERLSTTSTWLGWNTKPDVEKCWWQKGIISKFPGLLPGSFPCFLYQRTRPSVKKYWQILSIAGGRTCSKNLKQAVKVEILTGEASPCWKPVRHSIWLGSYNFRSPRIYIRKPSGR